MYCDVNPPSLISLGTQPYSHYLYIVDASSTFTYQLDLGGEFTSTDATICPLNAVFNADAAAAGYLTPSAYSGQVTFDTSSQKYV